MNRRQPARGFSLVELILVIVITGVLAGVAVVFVRPAIDSFVAQRARAELQGAAEAALTVMQRDIRRAVPNSLRTPSNACFELLPTVAGGRYRRDFDTARIGEAVLDTSQVIDRFDVLGPLNQSQAPQVGDWLVVGNQNVNDAYASGINRARISDPNLAVDAQLGSRRMVIEPRQFPSSYAGGRFVVVADSEQALFFVCANPGINSLGEGTGTLYRQKAYGFNATYPASCPAAGGEVLASRVSSCSFQLDGRTGTDYALLSLRLQLTRQGETVALQLSSMVSNAP